jgi:N-acetylmuramoyl-L-alanine amidase
LEAIGVFINHMTNVPTPPSPPSNKSVFHSFHYLPVVLGLAFIIASLFTIWTPGLTSISNLTPTRRVNNQTTKVPIESSNKTSETQIPTAVDQRLRIGLVAGHWGNDSGAVCDDGFTEADMNLLVASLVQKKLEDANFDVDLLEEFDPELLGFKASALVSIHADSCDFINSDATGYKVAASMANPFPEKSARLTSCLRSRYGQATGLPVHSQSVTADMTSYHAFGEIDQNTIAAIIEIGFLNLDREFLTNNTEIVADGIVSGLLCYINNESVSKSPEQGQP